MEFIDKLKALWKEGKFVCIGLDPVDDKIPPSVEGEDRIYEFNKALIDATHDIVLCYKPNSAFYEASGAEGIVQLKKTVEYIKSNYPTIPVILDAKRGDIGNTNDGYVRFSYDYLNADAITLHPYLGEEAMRPFLDRKEKGAIVLCKTSNEGSGEFQNSDNLYIKVAEHVSGQWNKNNNCALVVGATYPEELLSVRKAVGDMPILIPGIGAQGGDLEATVRNGVNSKKEGIIISSSRGIIFASNGKDFAKAAREEAVNLHNSIRDVIATL